MKILVVQTSILCDGSELFIHVATKRFIEKLNSNGHIVHISGSIFHDTVPGSNMETINPEYVCCFQRHFKGIGAIMSYCLSFFKSFRYIKKYDFIYLFMPGHYPMLLGFASMLLGKSTGIYLRVGNGAFGFINKILYKRSTFGFATGKGLTQSLHKYVKSNEVVPLLNFPNAKLSSYNYEASFNVIFVGRVSAEKGVDSLLAAFQNEKIRNRDIHLHIIGDGDSKLKLLGNSLNNVTMHGVISERNHLFALLHSADIFCLPSLAEGFPRVLYEASYSKCALLTTFVGSIGSMLKDNYNCLKLEKRSDSSIVEKILKLYEDPALLKKYQDHAFNFYQEKFKDIKGDHADQVLGAIGYASK